MNILSKKQTNGNESSSKSVVEKIGRRNVLSILMLGTAGQIAWAVENGWFNTFVYDRITTDPTPVALMVAVSAITATITTIIMGIFSDRTSGKWGQRKPYIIFGYILWGLITALFPLTEWIQVLGIAIVMVVVADAVMTFFGSTANDAAYNAWCTDIGHSSNRNRIQSLNTITTFIAQLITAVGAGIIIESFGDAGYFVFFYLLGGIVMATGVICSFLIESTPVKKEEIKTNKTVIQEFTSLVNPQLLKNNKTLFLLLLNMALSGIAAQIYMPYLLIFLEHYMGFSKTDISLYMAGFMFFTVLSLVIIGAVSHRFNRKSMVLVGSLIGGIVFIIVGFTSFSLAGGGPLSSGIFVLYFLAMVPGFVSGIAHGGWLLDSYPEGDVGKFQGIRMIFMVLLPMVIGPSIGAAIIQAFGTPTVDGFIPSPHIFIAGGFISFFAIIPILFIKKSEGTIELKTDE